MDGDRGQSLGVGGGPEQSLRMSDCGWRSAVRGCMMVGGQEAPEQHPGVQDGGGQAGWALGSLRFPVTPSCT